MFPAGVEDGGGVVVVLDGGGVDDGGVLEGGVDEGGVEEGGVGEGGVLVGFDGDVLVGGTGLLGGNDEPGSGFGGGVVVPGGGVPGRVGTGSCPPGVSAATFEESGAPTGTWLSGSVATPPR